MADTSPAWLDALLDLVDSGCSVAEAARRCGANYSTAYYYVRRARGRQAPQPDPDERARLHDRLARGESVRAAADALGIPKSRAYRLADGAARTKPKVYASELKTYALALIEAGETVAAVAERLGLRATTVNNWARKAGRRARPVLDDAPRRAFAEALADGASVPEAARRAGIGLTTAYRWARRTDAAAIEPMEVRTLPVARWPAELAAASAALAREERLALGRLCAAEGLTAAPAVVDVETFLARRAERLSPAVAARERRALLTALAKAAPGPRWTELTPKRDDAPAERGPRGKQRTISVPVDAWPAAARAAWEAARDPGYLEDGDAIAYRPGPLADRASWTLIGMERAYGLYLWSRQSCGKPLTVTPVGVQVFVNDCRKRGNRPRSIAAYVANLCRIAKVVHPDLDLGWLDRTRNALLARARDAPKKKWDEPPADPAALWAIGCDLLDRARRGAQDGRRNAALFRDGVLVMLLSSAPVRLENLAEIEIGANLVLPPDTPGVLKFRRTKNGGGSEHPLWPALRAALDEYLQDYRPVLLADHATAALWVGVKGGAPLTTGGVAKRIREITEDYLGWSLSPHRFRDAVATALVVEHPESPDLASAMLQHRNPESIGEYTEQGRTVGAARTLASLTQRARKQAEQALRSG